MKVRTHNATSRHRPDVGHKGPALPLRAFRAFSLAEMMIALAILAMGLLVIGASLPIGVRYTRESINMATGEAAAEYGLDVMEQSLCIPNKLFDSTSTQIRDAALFVPRGPNGGTTVNGIIYEEGQFIPTYEPLLKVRPFYTQNVNATPGATDYAEPWAYPVLENVVAQAVNAFGYAYDTVECDYATAWMRPGASAVVTMYPPAGPDLTPTNKVEYTPADFTTATIHSAWGLGGEGYKVLESLTSWTGFYRRVSYAAGSDPYVYEFITVAVRRPTLKSRFRVQNPATLGYSTVDTAVPVPWLVTFLNYPAPASYTILSSTERVLPLNYSPPGELWFTASALVGPLVPVGSVIIPAQNDLTPSQVGGNQLAGFIPSAPDALPIYEVAGRSENANGTFAVKVKYNGYFPWTNSGVATEWTAWVIPPAFEELSGGNPVFPDRSPIVGVARRTVRLRGIP